MAEYYVSQHASAQDHVDNDGSNDTTEAWASVGYAGSIMVDGDTLYIKYEASAYGLTNNTENTSGGPLTGPTNDQIHVIGYETTKDDGCPNGNRPVISADSTASVAWIIKTIGHILPIIR